MHAETDSEVLLRRSFFGSCGGGGVCVGGYKLERWCMLRRSLGVGSQGYKAAKEIIKLILSVRPQPTKVTTYLFLLMP